MCFVRAEREPRPSWRRTTPHDRHRELEEEVGKGEFCCRIFTTSNGVKVRAVSTDPALAGITQERKYSKSLIEWMEGM